jgi:uncharacterized protein with HEPN domain
LIVNFREPFSVGEEAIPKGASPFPRMESSQNWPGVNWKAIAGMRDRLIHDYFGVDYDIVWDVVENKIPSLREDILEILKKEDVL